MKIMTKTIFKTLIPVLIFAAACSGEGELETNGSDQNVTRSVNVKTETLSPQTFSSFLKVVGNVETSNDVMISAEVSGRVVEHMVNVGDKVKKGQTILKIDDTKLLQEKRRLEAVTEQSSTNYERLQRLYEEEQIGSEIEYLNARYAYEQNQSALASINTDLQNTTVAAPFDAVVEDILLEEGEMASPGVQIARLIGTRQYKITAGVPARYSDAVQVGDPVKVWFNTQAPDTIDAKISFVGKSINPQNRTFRIEVLLPQDQNSTYKVDMIASLQLTTLNEDNVIVVSEEFLYREDGNYIVYVASENEQGNPVAEKRTVTLGPTYRSDVVIRDGLAAGEELVTIGSAFLSNGMRLNIVENAENRMSAQRN